MEYLPLSEIARRWNLSERRVQTYCAAGRIAGAKKTARVWLVPANAQKPCDPRGGRREAAFFTLPRACPQLIMTTLYHTPGDAERVLLSLARDPEAQTLFAAELAYFRADTDTAARLAEAGLDSTARADVRMGCCFILCLSAMYAGDTEGWLYARTLMAQTPCRTPEEAAVRDFQLGSVDSGLYDKSGFPAWFTEGDFSPLPADCYPLARMLFLKWLMLSTGNPSLSAVCGPLVSQSRMEGAVLSEIYCRLIAAIGFHDRGDRARASREIDRAIALALPDRLYGPLAECRNELGLLLDERLAAVDKQAARAVRDACRRLLEGWATLCKDISGLTYTTALTAREHQAAKLAAKGLSNAEVAARMGLSINSVKRYISEAVAKTGAADRTGLAAFLTPEGETLP